MGKQIINTTTETSVLTVKLCYITYICNIVGVSLQYCDQLS
jgi:hypothetical protein